VTGFASHSAVPALGANCYLLLVAGGAGRLPREGDWAKAVFLKSGRSVVPVDAEAGRNYGVPEEKECGASSEENQSQPDQVPGILPVGPHDESLFRQKNRYRRRCLEIL
jgi:hypothetical protein